jgi:hypothetical protein
MPLLRIVTLLVTLALPSAAAAGDVCLWDGANEIFYALKNLKVPKKNGGAVPVAGHAVSAVSPFAAPVSGTLIRDPFEGTLTLGLTRYSDRCILTASLDETLNGSMGYDCNLDDVNDATVSVDRVDCDTL